MEKILFLTPASISYLNQFLLSVTIVVYLGFKFFRNVERLRREIALFVLMCSITIFSALLFFDVSLLPGHRLFFVYLQNPVLGVVVLSMLQFAYRFPEKNENHKFERRLTHFIFVLYTLGETGFAVWRFGLLSEGRVEFRQSWMDLGPLLGFAWVVFVFIRAMFKHWNLPASRTFALIFVIPFALVLLNIFRSFYLVPTPVFHISMSIGILLVMFSFVLNYLNAMPEQTSLLTKFSGAIITALLAVTGIIPWLVVPAYADRYQLDLPGPVTLHFTPTERGGYLVESRPYQYETDLGIKLMLTESDRNQPAMTVEGFPFEFFGQPYTQVTISNDGIIGFGDLPRLSSGKDFQYFFSTMPVLLPLLADLNPAASRGDAGIYLSRTDEQLVITYDRVPAFYNLEHLFSLQVVLKTDGSFDIAYLDFPTLNYYPDDQPDATLWAIGLKPAAALEYQHASLFATPLIIGPQGLVDDRYQAFRRYIHNFLTPLAVLIFSVNLLFAVGFPVLLYFTITRPLQTLLFGVQQWNTGKLDTQIPVQFNDEVGYLSDSFNRLGTQLGTLLKDLESAVQERTRDLSAANEEMRKLFIAVQQSPSAIVITNLNGAIEYANPAFEHSTGYRLDEVFGQNPRILKSNRTPSATYHEMWATISSGQTWRGELCNLRKNGQEFWEYTVIAPIRNETGTITHYVAVKEDVTDRVLTEQALKESERQYRELFELESDAIFIVRNSDGLILEANQAASKMYGYSLEELKQLRNTDLSAEPQKTQQASSSQIPTEQVVMIPLRMHRRSDGQVFPVEIAARFIQWKNQPVHIAAIRDITERRQSEAALEKLASTDSLTGLSNRRHFYDASAKIFRRAAYEGNSLVLLMMDIDHFKNVNDTYGHPAGDAVLREISARIQQTLRPLDLLARYGGEEFVAALLDHDYKNATDIAERLLHTVHSAPIIYMGQAISVTISLGIAQFEPSYKNIDEMLAAADQALYLAKEAGRNCFYLLPANTPPEA